MLDGICDGVENLPGLSEGNRDAVQKPLGHSEGDFYCSGNTVEGFDEDLKGVRDPIEDLDGHFDSVSDMLEAFEGFLEGV